MRFLGGLWFRPHLVRLLGPSWRALLGLRRGGATPQQRATLRGGGVPHHGVQRRQQVPRGAEDERLRLRRENLTRAEERRAEEHALSFFLSFLSFLSFLP